MKTIGLIGGTSYASTLDYYRIINEEINKRLGGLSSAQMLIYSVDYQTAVYEPKQQNDWHTIGNTFAEIALKLQRGGADMILIGANMPHKIADYITQIPLVHIGEVTGEHIAAKGYKKVGLIGSREVMEGDYLKKHYYPYRDGEVIIPDEADKEYINDVIFNEMCKGEFKEESRKEYLEIINKLSERGAEAVVMGCTEIPILLKEVSSPIPLLDTMTLHCLKAVDLSLKCHFD